MYNDPNRPQNHYGQNCSNCGAELPPGAAACPKCGALQYSFGTEASNPYAETAMASYKTDAAGAPEPATYYSDAPEPRQATIRAMPYSSQPYGAPNNASSYPAPPSTPARSPYIRIGIIIGVSLLLLALIGGGIAAVLLLGSGHTTPNVTPTPAGHATPTATATPVAQNPYPPNTGTLVLNDSLTDNSKGYKWDESSFSGTDSCGFAGGAYHVVEKTGLICIPEASNLNLSNFAFEVNIKIVKGDNGGIAFRVDQVNKTFYSFDIAPDGSYALYANGNKSTQLSRGTNSVINKGLNQSNLVAVVANGDLITIYVNNQIIDSVHDKSFSQGQVGVLSFANFNGTTINDVIASSARIWRL